MQRLHLYRMRDNQVTWRSGLNYDAVEPFHGVHFTHVLFHEVKNGDCPRKTECSAVSRAFLTAGRDVSLPRSLACMLGIA